MFQYKQEVIASSILTENAVHIIQNFDFKTVCLKTQL